MNASRPTRARKYLAALFLAEPEWGERPPKQIERARELLVLLDAAGAGNSIPGVVVEGMDNWLEIRGVMLTATGAEWVGPSVRAGDAR